MDLEQKLATYTSSSSCPVPLIREYCDRILSGYPVEKLPLFAERFPVLLKMLTTKNQDLSILELFLDRLEKVQDGQEDLKETEKDLAVVLNEKYVVPKLKEQNLS